MRKLLLAVLLLTGACATTDSNGNLVACPAEGCAALDPPDRFKQALLDHAAYDLQCPQQQLRVSYLDDSEIDAQVTGCGRQARYVGRYGSLRWRLDSPVFVVADPAQAQAHAQPAP
jgi:hypothetical protein